MRTGLINTLQSYLKRIFNPTQLQLDMVLAELKNALSRSDSAFSTVTLVDATSAGMNPRWKVVLFVASVPKTSGKA